MFGQNYRPLQIGSQAIEKPQITLPLVSWLVLLVQN